MRSPMPRRGEHQTTFAEVPLPPEQPRIGIRAVRGRNRIGTICEVAFDPTGFGCAALAAELADEWVDYVTVTNVGAMQAQLYRQAIREFCRFVDRELADAAPAASMARAVPDLGRTLAEWERGLPATRPAGSNRPAMLASAVRTLIARRGEHQDRAVDSRLLHLVLGEMGVEWGPGQELDEFSRKDKNRIVRVAWALVKPLEQRLARGWERAGDGRDPAIHGWTDISNLLWGLANQTITPADICAHLPPYRQWPDELRDGVCADRPHTRPRFAGQMKPALLRWLVRQLYPDPFDLHAYRILLVATTGYAPDEITPLTEDAVEFLPDGVRLTLIKRRAGRFRHRTFRGDHAGTGPDDREQEVATFPDQPRLEVAAIVRSLLTVTQQLRDRANDPDRRLFLAATVPATAELKIGRWAFNARTGFSWWLAANGIEITGRPDIRRLRKSTKVEKALAFGGRVADAANDHHEEVFRGHYAQGTTLRVLSGRVITTSQDHWLHKALTGPTLLASTEALDQPTVIEGSGLTRQQADALRQGTLDMGLTGCADPHDSPFGRPGELCPVAPLRCLECRNAWVLPSNLPQLLLFAEHLDRLRHRLSPEHFGLLWGQSHTNLHAVLAEHTDEEIALARKQIAGGEASLYLPLSAHVEFDS